MEIVLNQADHVLEQRHFPVREGTQVAAARRGGNAMSAALGFDETQSGRLALIITEVATNILKHAQEGQIFLRGLNEDGMTGVEVLAIDNGPGMGNFSASQADGVSTAGTAGTGLGAMRRLACDFDVFTAIGKGTAFYMTVWRDEAFRPRAALQLGVVALPLPGEDVCGDDWAVHMDGQQMTLMVADGLGHGPEAHLASSAATALLPHYPAYGPVRMLDAAHAALRSTRGAAIAVATVSLATGQLQFAGAGNIAATLYPPDGPRRQLMSHNGIVGHNMRTMQALTMPWQEESFLIMHSDGLATQWDLSHYPGLVYAHPALIAAVLYRDFFRKRDDVTVLVVRQLRQSPARRPIEGAA
jgi:anti-sigma regulatory factor (Ser/Thr protein kinase)